MDEAPTVDEFRRYLQEEIVKGSMITNSVEKEKRLWLLEAALLEAIKFSDEVAARQAVETEVFSNAAAVRVLSESTPLTEESLSGSTCAKCNETLADDLNFCPTCGYKKN